MSNTPASPVIAIDGPSASGKGTVARKLAEHFDFAYLDTGLLYRAVGALARAAGVDLDHAEALTAFSNALSVQAVIDKLPDPLLRNDESAQGASKVGVNPTVRANLLQFQRNYCVNPPGGKKGAVLDGRDIGTVIAPEAKVKIFVTASVEARADRRWKELQGRGETATYATVLEDLRIRDERDAKRATAPTLPAADAVILDTTSMTADDAFAEALRLALSRLK